MRGDSVRRWCLLGILILLLSACSVSQVNNDLPSYFLENMTFEKQYIDVLNEDVYEINDEWELARLIQYNYEMNRNESYYMCSKTLDLNLTSDYLTHIYPFDIKLVLQLETYSDSIQQTTSTYQHITIYNMDPFYEDTILFAKQNVQNIISDDMNTTQKIEAIHDYLVLHVSYDQSQLIQKDLQSNVFLAYGALMDKKAVCAGYARAFMIYMRLLNIPCLMVTSQQIDHAWNMVYDGTNWQYVDATWDDLDDGKIQYDYRNKSKEEFYKDEKHVLDVNESNTFYKKIGMQFFGY